MAQVLKQDIKDNIVHAATELFATRSYKQATMGMIAKEAGIATGNIYKYFPNKDALFHAIISPELVAEFSQLTANRVNALNQPERLPELDSIMDGEAGKLVKFWIRHRREVIILLSRAQGSNYESFYDDYIQGMFDQSSQLLPTTFPGLEHDQMFLFTFRNQLIDTVNGVVSILEKFTDEENILKALAVNWLYHHAGIQALTNWYSAGNK